VEEAEAEERRTGQLAASRAVAEGHGDRKAAAGIADEATRAAASKKYRGRRGRQVGGRFHRF